MKPMGWRFVVVSDLGLAAREPVRVPPGGPDEIRKALGLSSETALQGLSFLMKHAGDEVQVDLLSATAKDLTARFREAVFEPEVRELRNPPLGLVLLDFDFSHQSGDLATLQEVAELAKVAQAPVVAGASPAFFGLKELKLLSKLQDLPQRLMDGAHAGWQRFQKQEAARWVALTVNRWLLQAPQAQEKPESFLWGRGVWLVGAAIARSVRATGHALDISGPRAGGFAGMPTRPYFKAANQAVPLTTEIEFPDTMAQELSRGGFVPVSGRTGNDVLMIPIGVNAYRSAPGRLTVSGTLGYQMMAGRLAQLCSLLMDEMPGPAAEAADFLRQALVAFLGPLAGKDPGAAVKVSPVEAKDPEGKTLRLAEILVQPDARIEGMEFKFIFQLPLR
jgi:predicted component of type VI protein secretion system